MGFQRCVKADIMRGMRSIQTDDCNRKFLVDLFIIMNLFYSVKEIYIYFRRISALTIILVLIPKLYMPSGIDVLGLGDI